MQFQVKKENYKHLITEYKANAILKQLIILTLIKIWKCGTL